MSDKFDCQNDVQLNTCDKLLSEDSFQYFIGNIKDDYLKLISGLDDESIGVVVRILSRIRAYKESGVGTFWITSKEKEELLAVYDENCSKILKLSEDCFAFGKYLLPRKIISPTVFYYRHFLDQLKDVNKVKNKNIIDVGGFIGDSALILSEYTSKNVHIFEPVSELYNLLLQTINLNNLKNVVTNKLALGETIETLNINIAGDHSTLCMDEHIKQYNCKQESVSVTTLDSYVKKHKLDVGLIKVDIEGFEQQFLRGAQETIKQQKPTLLLSIYHNAEDFFKIKPLIESWNLGYKFRVVKPADKSILIDTNLIAEVPD